MATKKTEKVAPVAATGHIPITNDSHATSDTSIHVMQYTSCNIMSDRDNHDTPEFGFMRDRR